MKDYKVDKVTELYLFIIHPLTYSFISIDQESLTKFIKLYLLNCRFSSSVVDVIESTRETKDSS